jgi:cell division protein FtsQ
MTGRFVAKLLAWGIALTLVALPILGVLNGWFAGDRWPVTKLSVSAEFNHVSAEQIRAAAQPQLGKGFFALDLDDVRDALAKLPWVERAEVRKRWPDTVDLLISAQQPSARWGGQRLVNRQGRLFSVAGAEGLQGLPRLAGPDDRLDDVLRFYADSQREFSGSGLVIDAVTLSPRGGWRIELVSGTVIELGRTDAQPRLQRFLDVWPRLAGSHPQAPAYVDLRYANGFSMRWAAPAPAEPAPTGARESETGNGPPQTAASHSVAHPFSIDPTMSFASPRVAARAIPDSRLLIPGPP